MPSQKDGPDIEIWFGLHLGRHGGEPLPGDGAILIGAGLFDDLDRIMGEVKAIDGAEEIDRSAVTSAGARHFYLALGRNAGLEDRAEAALDFTERLVLASREAFRNKLRDGSLDVNNSAVLDQTD